MNNERMLTLYNFMASLPSRVIDMDSWRQSDDGANNRDIKNKQLRAAIEDPSCGTQACALGWACAIPEFKKAGLKYGQQECNYFGPIFGDLEDFDAGAAFFGQTEEQSNDLFAGAEYADEDGMTHKQGFLRRARKLLVEGGAITKDTALEMHIAELRRDYEEGVY
jgi:hypothetical protein